MVAKPLYPLYKNIIKPLDRVRYPELRYVTPPDGGKDNTGDTTQGGGTNQGGDSTQTGGSSNTGSSGSDGSDGLE